MHRDELEGWLRLTLTPGVGNQAARRLLAAFGLPASVFAQSREALQTVVSAAQATAVGARPEGLDALLQATVAWLQDRPSEQEGASKAIVTLGDARYPAPLLELPDPPLVLYFHGAATCLADEPAAAKALALCFSHSVAMVGSRNPTGQGLVNAKQFAGALVQAGLTVVSGMALGIDGAAHEGALDAAQASPPCLATIAVVGTGLDRVYPKQHLALARRIARHGLLLSEYPIGTPPLAENFPKRNRIIAALSRGTVVVEAALKSGSLITAREATEQGKEVFAIPGSIHSTQSRGCHALIRQGAKLVESAQDVLEELHWTGGGVARADAADGVEAEEADIARPGPRAEGALLRALGHDPLGLDALQARTGLDTARLQAELMELELAGEVVRLPGGLFQRISTA